MSATIGKPGAVSSPPTKTCGSCVYWRRIGVHGYKREADGRCLRFPPVLVHPDIRDKSGEETERVIHYMAWAQPVTEETTTRLR